MYGLDSITTEGGKRGFKVTSYDEAEGPRAPKTLCFVAGTQIATTRGPVTIERIVPGDLILTRDNGYRPVRWTSSEDLDAAALRAFPVMQPVRIRAGALAQGFPDHDLIVSPQHGILLFGDLARLLCNESEMLVAAEDLVPLNLAAPARLSGVTYCYMMLDGHEIVLANGCWAESFQPDAAAMDALRGAQRREILRIFPELSSRSVGDGFANARRAYRPMPSVTAAA